MAKKAIFVLAWATCWLGTMFWAQKLSIKTLRDDLSESKRLNHALMYHLEEVAAQRDQAQAECRRRP